MSNDLLLDTDILVNVGRDCADAGTRVSALMAAGPVYISAVTEMELVIGCRNKAELRNLAKFLDQYTIIPITPEITASSIKLLKSNRLSHGLLIADSLIAATALVTNRVLVSGNAKHFSMISPLQLIPA